MTSVASAKRQNIETGAGTLPCCKKMAIHVVPQITTTRQYNNAFIVHLFSVDLLLILARNAWPGLHRFAVNLQNLALFYRLAGQRAGKAGKLGIWLIIC
jgi:hypothetical protein